MKKSFRLEGLDCANCASKIEVEIKKLTGVEEVTVNFMTTRLSIRAERADMPRIVEEATKIVKRYEPHVEVVKA